MVLSSMAVETSHPFMIRSCSEFEKTEFPVASIKNQSISIFRSFPKIFLEAMA